MMGKADVFSCTYENLDQELKNACLKYEASQAKKGLRVTSIVLRFTPKEAPYIEIDVDEEVKIKGQRVKVASVPPKSAVKCKHPSTVCNGLGQLECVMCDLSVKGCKDEMCNRCGTKSDEAIPPTLRSSRFPGVIEEEDELDELG